MRPGSTPSRCRALGSPRLLLALLVPLTATLGACGAPDEGSGDSAPPAGGSTSGHDRMLAVLADIAERTDENNYFLSISLADEARARLAGAPANLPPGRACELLYRTAYQQSRVGREQEAIALLQQADALAARFPDALPPRQATAIKYRLAVYSLRLAETENCCKLASPESCIFPIRGGGIHTKEEGSRAAIGYLEALLESVPEQSAIGLRAKWLLNIAYMTLDEWPDEVPERHLIPPSVFASGQEFPRFPNVAAARGVNAFDLAGGAVVEDFDRDGDLDLLTSTWDTRGPMHYYANEGETGWVERTAEAGLGGELGGLNLIHADYDNDGYADVLVLRGAWFGPAGKHPNSLLRNQGNGTFRDVTFEAGMGERSFPTQTADWADYDLDGDLDLYVGAESGSDLGAGLLEEEERTTMYEPGQLFRNEGNGTFTDVAAPAGVENLRFAKGVSWGDFDGDRYPDLYVSNLESDNRLYRNRGDGTFEDVAPALGVTGPSNSFPAWFWDFDNDGDLDLYVATFKGSPNALSYAAAAWIGREVPGSESPALYRNDGGRFVDVAAELGVGRESLTMGANFGDLDGDGWLDFHLGTGYPDYEALMPNVMYRNRGGTGFSDVTVAGGFGHLQKGHAIVFADLDEDGDQDVFSQLGGAFPGDAYANALYENPGFGHRWVTVELTGTRSNRCAMGARIRVDVIEDGRPRSVYGHVGTGGSFGSNPLRRNIGLGNAERIERIEILWPAPGDDAIQEIRDVPLDSFVEITEGQDGFRLREPAPSPHRAG